MNAKYFLSAVIITITITTGALLMPIAEYNSSRYMTDETEKLGELLIGEEALTVGLFGEKISVKTKNVTETFRTITPFLPNELKLSMQVIQQIAERIGEAQ